MSRSERRKGVDGEREVRRLFEQHDFTVRGLEGSGDWLALGHGLVVHVETKRQEIARPWPWIEQATSQAPPGALPLVAFRRSRSPWIALAPLDPLLAILEQLGAKGNGGTIYAHRVEVEPGLAP